LGAEGSHRGQVPSPFGLLRLMAYKVVQNRPRQARAPALAVPSTSSKFAARNSRTRSPLWAQSRGRGTQNRPFENKTIEAEASAVTTLRESGTGCRAEALPKVRNLFEGAQHFLEVRILENAGDSFEDAHRFPRCARKVRLLEGRRARSPVPAGLCIFDVCDAMPNC
jgi:hypothetical protein